MGMFLPLFFIPTYATIRGINATLAGYLSAILSASSTFGRVIPGILADRVRDVGTYAGMAMAVGALGGLIGPPLDGGMINHYHDFFRVAMFSGNVCFLVVLLHLGTSSSSQRVCAVRPESPTREAGGQMRKLGGGVNLDP